MAPSEGHYISTKTVGSGRDYATIGEAVDYWWTQLAHLSSTSRGKILIDSGTFDEMLCNDAYGYTNTGGSVSYGTGGIVPPFVDLIGDGVTRSLIQYSPDGPTSNAVPIVIFAGDSYLENIDIRNISGDVGRAIGYAWNSQKIVEMSLLEMDDVYMSGRHGAINVGWAEVIISNSEIVSSAFGSCISCGSIQLDTVTLSPGTYTPNPQYPGGIQISGDSLAGDGSRTSVINNLTMDVACSGDATGSIFRLYGVEVYGRNNLVYLTNSSIKLVATVTSVPGPVPTVVAGVFENNSLHYLQRNNAILISDTSIEVSGIEESTGGIKVLGAWKNSTDGCLYFGKNTSIATSRSGSAGEGEEYALKQESGNIKINQASLDYDKNKTSGTIETIKYMVV